MGKNECFENFKEVFQKKTKYTCKEKYIDEKIREEKYFEDDGRFNDYILSDFVLFFWEA